MTIVGVTGDVRQDSPASAPEPHRRAVTYATVLIAVTPIILLAAAVPAWRAGRIDQVTALRQ
jgi:ABC-type lipoprotein release transport system permease subunit